MLDFPLNKLSPPIPDCTLTFITNIANQLGNKVHCVANATVQQKQTSVSQSCDSTQSLGYTEVASCSSNSESSCIDELADDEASFGSTEKESWTSKAEELAVGASVGMVNDVAEEESRLSVW